MKNTVPRPCPPRDGESLPDAAGLMLDERVPIHERADWLKTRLGGLNRFRVGELVVNLTFTEGGPPMEAQFTDLLIRKKREA